MLLYVYRPRLRLAQKPKHAKIHPNFCLTKRTPPPNYSHGLAIGRTRVFNIQDFTQIVPH